MHQGVSPEWMMTALALDLLISGPELLKCLMALGGLHRPSLTLCLRYRHGRVEISSDRRPSLTQPTPGCASSCRVYRITM
ncbi:hypothetical protein PoB_007699800 [Plakobranchus ocellatus]|uniref:Secreted protein n=1 Tax=Plakobranchus ocellatus TaxID=259542 RepID=A0AAV4E1R0_9GAST|nr:hypothetical protein PoB_007699800 [Plakobranchus ocellatus]